MRNVYILLKDCKGHFWNVYFVTKYAIVFASHTISTWILTKKSSWRTGLLLMVEKLSTYWMICSKKSKKEGLRTKNLQPFFVEVVSEMVSKSNKWLKYHVYRITVVSSSLTLATVLKPLKILDLQYFGGSFLSKNWYRNTNVFCAFKRPFV